MSAKKKKTWGLDLGIGLGGSMGIGIGMGIGMGVGVVVSVLFILRNTPLPKKVENYLVRKKLTS